ACSLRLLRGDVGFLIVRMDACIGEHLSIGEAKPTGFKSGLTELLIVDEAERLSTTGQEHVRDVFDRTGIGVILIGMPGIEKRLSRYPQLYSRVGFAHHYRPLRGDELTFVLTRHWRQLGLALDEADFTDVQAVASIARITGGNFR
ncbi:AAA family ATPase, partial [Escherichia coli]|nr:AAA family ATPase [Escherichia coli]